MDPEKQNQTVTLSPEKTAPATAAIPGTMNEHNDIKAGDSELLGSSPTPMGYYWILTRPSDAGVQARAAPALLHPRDLRHRVQHHGPSAVDCVDADVFAACGARGDGLGMLHTQVQMKFCILMILLAGYV